jgi:hypothetical protein
MPQNDWIDITEKSPDQGQRILARMLDGRAVIVNYCRFCFDHWKIQYWKAIPNNVPDGNVERK